MRYHETVEQCVLRETREETGYRVILHELVGIYSSLKRDPRFRAVCIAYRGSIVDGDLRHSGEGKVCWREPGDVFGHLAFDCEAMLKDYLNHQQSLS